LGTAFLIGAATAFLTLFSEAGALGSEGALKLGSEGAAFFRLGSEGAAFFRLGSEGSEGAALLTSFLMFLGAALLSGGSEGAAFFSSLVAFCRTAAAVSTQQGRARIARIGLQVS
jgi:hypothetical protein